jgi:hypothetical protein
MERAINASYFLGLLLNVAGVIISHSALFSSIRQRAEIEAKIDEIDESIESLEHEVEAVQQLLGSLYSSACSPMSDQVLPRILEAIKRRIDDAQTQTKTLDQDVKHPDAEEPHLYAKAFKRLYLVGTVTSSMAFMLVGIHLFGLGFCLWCIDTQPRAVWIPVVVAVGVTVCYTFTNEVFSFPHMPFCTLVRNVYQDRRISRNEKKKKLKQLEEAQNEKQDGPELDERRERVERLRNKLEDVVAIVGFRLSQCYRILMNDKFGLMATSHGYATSASISRQ